MSLISSINSSLQFPVASRSESSGNSTSANQVAYASISRSSGVNSSDEASVGIKKIFDIVNTDPEFAKQMADVYTHTPDRELISLADVPLHDLQAWQEYQDRTNAFNRVAEGVTAQRVDIYNNMKANGSSDADIFKSIMTFNKSLPLDYQLRAGLVKYSVYA